MALTYLFDLDDTIIDSSLYSKMYNEIITKLKEKPFGELKVKQEIEKLKKETGKERPDTYELSSRLGEDKLYYEVLKKYLDHTYVLKSKEITEIFKRLSGEKKRIGIVSSSQEKTVKMVLDRYRLLDYVDFIEHGDKRSISFWMRIEKKHNLFIPETLVIDDSDEILNVAEQVGYKTLSAKMLGEITNY
jgi:phosphoglycolate phosphatase-like HAD superfamily hydrolase